MLLWVLFVISMNPFLLVAYIVAAFLSFFVVGILLGSLFIRSEKSHAPARPANHPAPASDSSSASRSALLRQLKRPAPSVQSPLQPPMALAFATSVPVAANALQMDIRPRDANTPQPRRQPVASTSSVPREKAHVIAVRAAGDFVAHANQRIRTLMFGWEFPPFNSGGLGVACLGLTRALAGQNLDITFVMPKKLPLAISFARMVSAELENAGAHVTIHAVNSTILPYASFGGGSYAVSEDGVTPIYGSDLIAETQRYARFGALIASREPHDLVYAHDWLSFGAGREAKRVAHQPFIAHLHATEFDRTGGNINQAVYDLERAGMHAADRVIAVSHRTKDAAIRHYGIAPEKMRVVWNGIDDATAPAANSGIPERLAALKRAGYKLVLFLGRITIQKGPDYFVRAARRVADHDPDVLFILAGSGDMEHQVIREAAALGLADRILFPGFLRGHDQYEAYALADLFVMPSVSEPFGITALEAMRLGTPVIVSKQSGVAESVKNVLTVDFWDTEKMADLMLSVLESPELYNQLSTRGSREASTLTWERAGREVRRVIDEVVSPYPATA